MAHKILPITQDRGSALSIYRHVLDTLREGTDIPAEEFIVYLGEMRKRTASNGAIGMLTKRMVEEWLTHHDVENTYWLVPVVDVTATRFVD